MDVTPRAAGVTPRRSGSRRASGGDASPGRDRRSPAAPGFAPRRPGLGAGRLAGSAVRLLWRRPPGRRGVPLRAGRLDARKAAVASVLIEHALERTLADGRPRAPWAWADFHPVARLRVPLGLDQPVLSGATGATLAFGLGRVSGHRDWPVLAGHRDTWAAFLQDLRVGDRVVLEGCGESGLPRRRRPRGGPRCHRGALPHRRGSADPRDLLAVLGLARARMRVLVTCTAKLWRPAPPSRGRPPSSGTCRRHAAPRAGAAGG